MKTFDFEKIPSQKGRIAIVTGANAGLGFETVKYFAQKEIEVIMACRDLKKGEDAKSEIIKDYPAATLQVMELDLASLESVRKFAKNYKAKHNQLDLLINNAGIMAPPLMRTEEDFEIQFGVNHLGHFLLSNLLMSTLTETKGSRVVVLSSLAHRDGKINFDDINWEKSYSKFTAYGQSKLANLMFALDLQERLEKAGSDTIAVAAHPGIARTSLARHFNKIVVYLLMPIFYFMSQKPNKGALPTVMAALDPSIKGGEYFGPQGRREMTGKPGRAKISEHAKDKEVRDKLWKISEELTDKKFEIS